MGNYRWLTFAFATATLAACAGENQTAAPTAPDAGPQFAMSTSSVCDPKFTNEMTKIQKDLFAKPTLDTAGTLWSSVTSACGVSIDAAREAMLAYVRFTILAERDGRVITADPAQSIVNHWDTTFQYVGYPAPRLNRIVLSNDGAAKVVLASEATAAGTEVTAAAEFGIPRKAAMTVYKQYATGDRRGHLFTIAPLPSGCLTTNLVQSGNCFDFSSFPNVSTSTSGKFDPGIKVGICHEGTSPEPAVPALGHRHNTRTEIAQLTSTYPSVSFCDGLGETLPQFGGTFGVLKYLAFEAGKLLSVRKAYAAHGGLGGVSETLSPFGPVDLLIFRASFDAIPAGTTPTPTGAYGPEVGTWSKIFATSPGSITVQESLGDLAVKPVVLSQGGGACTACGSLDLWGRVASSSPSLLASNGVYRVSWESLQNGPTVKSAPFVVRSSTGAEIARVEYTQVASMNVLNFNGNRLDSPWVRNVKQKFDITIDLDAKTMSLSINGIPAQPLAKTQNIPFTATDVAAVQAEFTGIDSGVVGWDNINVVRLAGQ